MRDKNSVDKTYILRRSMAMGVATRVQQLASLGLSGLPQSLKRKIAGQPISDGGKTLDPSIQMFLRVEGTLFPELSRLPVKALRRRIKTSALLMESKKRPVKDVEEIYIPITGNDFSRCRLYRAHHHSQPRRFRDR